MDFKLFNKKQNNEDRDEILVQFDKEARKRELMKPVKVICDATEKAFNWACEHPVEALTIGSMVISGTYKGVKLITKHRTMRHEQKIADCRLYDRRFDEYVWTRRKLTNDEKLYLERKYAQGKENRVSYRQILTDMGLIGK